MKPLVREIYDQFKDTFQGEPLIVRSPGRINLIGEHTDYNNGFVMPAAIDKEIIFAIGASSNAKTVVYSSKYDEQIELDIKNPQKTDHPAWANYLLGVLSQLLTDGHEIKSFNCVFGGDIPTGSGMSSSAALECGFGFALNELFQLRIPKIKLIKMAQWAEHHFVGVKCGIMDQFASVMGKEGSVILLDCQSLEYRYAPIDMREYIIVLCDTKVKHTLVDSEYNKRREECENGVSILKKHYPQVNSLRDASVEMVEKHRSEFPGKVYDRCAYVVSEIARVQSATKDLESGNMKAFGKKMYETHVGLSTQYEVSCKELDFLVEEARKFESVLGARMMGGGFGGCTINIVKESEANEFIKHTTAAYKNAFGIDMPSYRVKIKEGTSLLTLSNAELSHV
jgi:galactokinase